LQKLARLNALELSYGRYEYDADRLVNLLQQVLSPAQRQEQAGQLQFSRAAMPGRARPGMADMATAGVMDVLSGCEQQSPGS